KFVGFYSEDLGVFYLDILKDRLYTSCPDSRPRRAAQSALWHITQTLMRLIAPVLSFTAEEIWQTLNPSSETSVFEQEWHVLPEHGLGGKEILAWEDIINVRALVNKKIEEKREAGLVGSSLQSEIDIYAFDAIHHPLSRLGDDLRFVLITSRATLHHRAGSGVGIDVTPSVHQKCERCWHYRADVGAHADHPHICGRCVSNLYGDGEPRQFA
ncbi:MAG TPA: class I tRNA ligase family protein, partial [Methylophilaceae bacterium]|nr:class I tRNA ligase family protein [Methylophilaceae bacterium]